MDLFVFRECTYKLVPNDFVQNPTEKDRLQKYRRKTKQKGGHSASEKNDCPFVCIFLSFAGIISVVGGGIEGPEHEESEGNKGNAKDIEHRK